MNRALSNVTSTKELKQLQAVFFQIISRPLGNKWAMSPDRRTASMIRPSPLLSAHERLELYARQYWWRVLDSLREDFPGVRKLLGDKRFASLLVRYIRKHPSKTFTLRNLGQFMPQFLSRDRELPSLTRIKASAIAKVEWAQIEAFDAASLPPLSRDTLVSGGENLRLTVQPYVMIVSVPFSVDEYIGSARESLLRSDASNVRSENSSRSTDASKGGRLSKAKLVLAIYRLQGGVYSARLSLIEHELIRELQRGQTIAQVFRRLLKRASRVRTEEVQAAFHRFASLGWVAPKPGRQLSPERPPKAPRG